MKVCFKFFDKDDRWSIHATILSIIILIVYLLGLKNILKLKILVFATLISMIQADLWPKMIFIFFMCMICWNKDEFILGTSLSLLAGILVHYIPKNNFLVDAFMNNKILYYFFYTVITIWCIAIGFILIYEMFDINIIKYIKNKL